MSYVICKEPNIRIDLMVKKQYYPQLIGYFQRMGCTYKKEIERHFGNDESWIILKNVQADNGMKIGQLIGLFYSMDWQGLTEGKEDKFYILLNSWKKGKKYAGKDRKEIHQGSEVGTAGGSTGAVRYEGSVECSGDGSGIGVSGTDDPGTDQGEQ